MHKEFRAGAAAAVCLAMAASMVACGSGMACPPGTEAVGEGCVEQGDDGPSERDARASDDDAAARDDAGDLADANHVKCDPLAIDTIDLRDSDENCDGIDGTIDGQWYVSPEGDDGNRGTIEAPFQTIGQALRATPQRPVLVAVGNYDLEHFTGWVAVRGRVAIHGGYDAASWRRTAARSTVSVGAQGQEMRFFDSAPEVLIERIELLGAVADPTSPGASALALVLRGDATAIDARAVLRNGVIHTKRGAAGADGDTGADGEPGHAGTRGARASTRAGGARRRWCTSSTVPAVATAETGGFCREWRAQDGNGGASRMPGTSSHAGRSGGGSSSYSDGTDGDSGRTGSPGRHGSAPTSALGVIELAEDDVGYVSSSGERGEIGQAGEGGGGALGTYGGACMSGDVRTRSLTGSAPGGGGGSGGDGGCGGVGGAGGGGGGGSIAVVLRGVTLVLEGANIETSAAGLGGDGGAGGLGAIGGDGGGVRNTRGELGPGSLHLCDLRSGARGLAGGLGGHGGLGGDGGAGAGGAGGVSIGVAVLDGASVERDAASSFALGPAGVGGTSAGNRGPDGVRVEVRELLGR